MRLKTATAGLATALTAAGLVAAGIPVQAHAQSTSAAESFTIVVAGNAPQLFVARGAVDVTGTAVEEVSEGASGGTDVVRVPGGTFMLTLQNTSGGGTPVNPVTCVATFFGAGTFTIFDGTGQFAGIAGSGTITFHGAFIAKPTPQGCSQQGTEFDLVLGHGNLTV